MGVGEVQKVENAQVISASTGSKTKESADQTFKKTLSEACINIRKDENKYKYAKQTLSELTIKEIEKHLDGDGRGVKGCEECDRLLRPLKYKTENKETDGKTKTEENKV
jgi:methionyl-tRNA synthetase